MISLRKALNSTLGRKFLIALTGLGAVGFTITHLAGNLTLFQADGVNFNTYTQQLHNFGPLLTIAEIGLVVLFVGHIVLASLTTARNKSARAAGYRQWKSKGASSSNVSSRNMIISGSLLLVFLALHIWRFRFGPGIAEGYVTQVAGQEARDLHRLVVETFKSPYYVAFYTVSMLFFGLHLRHGIWSSIQSLGIMKPAWSRAIAAIGVSLAVVLAVGFLLIPLWMYFDVPALIAGSGGR